MLRFSLSLNCITALIFWCLILRWLLIGQSWDWETCFDLFKKQNKTFSRRKGRFGSRNWCHSWYGIQQSEVFKKCCKNILATAESLFGCWCFPHPALNAALQRSFDQNSNILKKFGDRCNISRLKGVYPALLLVCPGWFRAWFMLLSTRVYAWAQAELKGRMEDRTDST